MKPPCSEEGCQEESKVKGLCMKHYHHRWHLANRPTAPHPRKRKGPKPTDPVVRFWRFVNKNGPLPEGHEELGPCWLWTGATMKTGYGVFTWKYERGVTRLAHRIAWIWEHGPIAGDLEVDHVCEVESCVRVSHMQLLPPDQNKVKRKFPGRKAA